MIQIYSPVKDAVPIPKERYVEKSGKNGYTYETHVEGEWLAVKVKGTAPAGEGYYSIMVVEDKMEWDEIGDFLRVEASRKSDPSGVSFGIRYKNGNTGLNYVLYVSEAWGTEYDFVKDANKKDIQVAVIIKAGSTVDVELKVRAFYGTNPFKTEAEFMNRNGNAVLMPTKATVHPILNGSWEAELQHPIDPDGRWKYITEEAVVKMPSFNGTQLFRIKSKQKVDSGVTAVMEPIFFDAMDDCFLEDVRPTKKNGQQALDLMTAPNSKYSGRSNITTANTAYYQYKNLIEAINGDDDNSFVNRWGGEILFDNYNVIINTRVGGDYGVELRYGKNIPTDGLTEEVDMRSVVTRIYPKAYNGYTMTGTKYVDSPLRDSYPNIKTATITFDDVKMEADATEEDAENGVTICKNQTELNNALKKRCQDQWDAGLDKPLVTISADMVLLQNTEQYKDYAVLEEVSLGDTVHCIHSRLGIRTDARVIELEYDSVRKKVTSVVLGDFQYNYFNNVSSAVNRIDGVIRPDGSLVAELVKGFLDGSMTRLRAQYNIAQKQDVLAILFENLDTSSPLYGAMGLGTQGLMISKTRTADGKDWDWTTAMTANGLMAGIIVAGILADKTGRNYWNLDSGDIKLTGKFRNESVNSWGTEYIEMLDAIISGGIGAKRTGLLDLAAQYEDGNKHVVLESVDGTLHLKAKKVSIEAEEVTGLQGGYDAGDI